MAEMTKPVPVSVEVGEAFKAAFNVPLTEDYGYGASPEQVAMRMAVGSLSDEDLRAKRSQMVDKRSAVKAKMSKMGDMKYSTPEGSQCMADCYYYDAIIGALEVEMRLRLMALDG